MICATVASVALRYWYPETSRALLLLPKPTTAGQLTERLIKPGSAGAPSRLDFLHVKHTEQENIK
jgi:hypothetical protein